MSKRRPGDRPRMILDRAMCVRVADGDEVAAAPHYVYHCAECCLTPDTFSGKLGTDKGPTPVCEDHEPAVPMVRT